MAQTHARKLHHETYYLEASTWERGRNIIAFIGLVALAASAAGAFADPARFRQSWLVGFASAVTIVLGGMFFVMIQYLTGSAWSRHASPADGEPDGDASPSARWPSYPSRSGCTTCTSGLTRAFWRTTRSCRGKRCISTRPCSRCEPRSTSPSGAIWAVGIWRASTKQDRGEID